MFVALVQVLFDEQVLFHHGLVGLWCRPRLQCVSLIDAYNGKTKTLNAVEKLYILL